MPLAEGHSPHCVGMSNALHILDVWEGRESGMRRAECFCFCFSFFSLLAEIFVISFVGFFLRVVARQS